jgi:hypothetical protein
MLKNKSYFKKCSGDEAATKSLGQGVVTHTIGGKVYFAAWSANVRAEGENVVRHLDLMTSNHASPMANESVPIVETEKMSPPDHESCADYANDAATACENAKPKMRTIKKGKRKGKKTQDGLNCSKACKKAKQCILVPKGKDKKQCCSPNTTGDHLIEDHWTKGAPDFKGIPNLYSGAPCMCVNKSRYHGKHGVAHGIRGVLEDRKIGQQLNYQEAKKMTLTSFDHANPRHKCDKKCIEKQLDDFYGPDGNKQCNTPTRRQPLTDAQRKVAEGKVASKFSAPVSGY